MIGSAGSPSGLAGQTFVLPSKPLAVAWNGRMIDVLHWRKYSLVFLATTLCSTVLLKVAEIQYLEWIFAFDFLLLFTLVLRDGFRLQLFRPYLSIARSFGIFLAAAFLLSLISLQQTFPPVGQTSPLKAPVIVTLARIAELFLDAFYMLYLASLFKDDEKLCIFGLKVYLWTGLLGCLYSFVTFPFNFLFEAQLGTYSMQHRFRGFDNEGGGFGVYLVSVLVVTVILYRRRWITRPKFIAYLILLSVGLVGSQSKSSFFAIATLCIICLTWFVRGWRKWAFVAGVVLSLAVVGTVLNIGDQIDVYRISSAKYQQLSNLKATDGNYVMGRVAGAVLAPRMIAAHPLTGIGWGNYPLVRDAIEYRQGTAFALGLTDSPSLGIVDYIVELGIPLWLYLTWVELKPVWMLRRIRADVWLLALALIQPVSNWAGAHLNIIHPWIAGAFALGIAYRSKPTTSIGEATSL